MSKESRNTTSYSRVGNKSQLKDSKEELTPLAMDLLFEMTYHGDIKYRDMPEEYHAEYEKWRNEHCKDDSD